jgi:hypothetical protein
MARSDRLEAGAFQVDTATGTILNQAVTAGSMKDAATDQSSIGLNASTKKLEVKDEGISPAKVSYPQGRWIGGSLTASDAAQGILSYENARVVGKDLKCIRLIVDLQTPTTAACTADFGCGAGGGSTDTLMDGLDLSVAGVFDNLLAANHGGNGGNTADLDDTFFLSGSKATGATLGLAGYWAALLLDVENY